MRYRGVVSIVEGFIRWRWPRFLVAIIALILGTIFALSAFGEADVKSAHAVQIDGLYTATNSSSGAYMYSRVTLVGSTGDYVYNRADFTPELTDQAILNAAKVDIWYNDAPLSGRPHLIAIQFYSAEGTPTTKCVTEWYLHPDRMRNSGLRTAGVPLAIALAFGLWGILPKRRKPKPISN